VAKNPQAAPRRDADSFDNERYTNFVCVRLLALMQGQTMYDSGNKDLAYHHSEIARLTAAIAVARPNARTTAALRTKLKHHEDRIGRPAAVATPNTQY
jgi:hypothetical protein